MWMRDERCKVVIREAWGTSSSIHVINVLHKFRTVPRLLSDLLVREEDMWRQRSRVDWLKRGGGDSNTKKFHAKASSSRKTNALLKLQGKMGNYFVGDAKIVELVSRYYGELFKTFDPNEVEIVVSSVTSRIDEEGVQMLNPPFVISKVLAHRLKKVLPGIIHHTQSTFVPGRMIRNNALVAFEAFHSMRTRMKGVIGYFAFKLDMSKAYDRVEWSFLDKIMHKMNFPNQF
ncbi:hypothetical protein M5689_024851 [Euphorbia peplus]|nr:hypothetical protein M5689_024851 [Euphorbia peplus]